MAQKKEYATKTHNLMVACAWLHNVYGAWCMSLSMWEVWGSILWPVKPDTLWPTARHHCYVSSELRCPGAKQRGGVTPLVIMLRYYSECNETSIMKILFNFLQKFLCAAIVTADTPHLKKLLLIKCFTVASMTKIQFKQNTSKKLHYRYWCIAS